MPETITRRAYLLAAIRRECGPITVHAAEQLMASSPWPTARRNTLRKDLRGLAAHGHLTALEVDGRRVYHPTTTGEDGRS